MICINPEYAYNPFKDAFIVMFSLVFPIDFNSKRRVFDKEYKPVKSENVFICLFCYLLFSFAKIQHKTICSALQALQTVFPCAFSLIVLYLHPLKQQST